MITSPIYEKIDALTPRSFPSEAAHPVFFDSASFRNGRGVSYPFHAPEGGLFVPDIYRSLRFRILIRDDFTCQYCGRRSPDVVLEVDHIVARSRGGSNRESNLTTACYDCNHGKHARELTEAQIARFSKLPAPKVVAPKLVVAKPDSKPVAPKPIRRKVAHKGGVMLPVYNGGAYKGRFWFASVPVSLGFKYIAPDTFIGEWRCENCGFYCAYERDQCPCQREIRERQNNHGLTNREIERTYEKEEPCDCYECDICAEERPECAACGENYRIEYRRYCEACWLEEYGETFAESIGVDN